MNEQDLSKIVCLAVGHMKIKNNGEYNIKVIIQIQAAAVGCRREGRMVAVVEYGKWWHG